MDLELEYAEQYRFLQRDRATGKVNYGSWLGTRTLHTLSGPLEDAHHVTRDKAAIEHYEQYRLEHEALRMSQVRIVRRWVSQYEPVPHELHTPINHPETETSP